ncbi:DUF4184 family protein [Micromonospora zingiberis]|uniref:DUF4184 family protein n=1 Tax=Micromonospora zingiberis TaxID=2053011 RepID=A0A4V6N3A4_9ACTN|nr:DUF4184 family protein [Micromonospora zingiberis]TCB96865.1 DUF4184 family protein [Micromonospora zingiberis]
MPLTFPSHLAPVLVMKLWRPRWFDGVALSTGAVAPDVAYLVTGSDGHSFADTHAWSALIWWCLPVALAYAWVFRSSIDTVAAHLPMGRRYGWWSGVSLAHGGHRWWITISSALLGAASHLAWDWLTHTDEWLMVFGLRWSSVTDVAWWTVSDLTSTGLGAVVAIWCLARLGRRRTRPGCGPERAARRPGVFWAAVTVVAVVGLVAVPLLPGASFPAATGVRLIHLTAVALPAGGLAVRIWPARPPG